MINIGHMDYRRSIAQSEKYQNALKLYAINKRVERNEELVETGIRDKQDKNIQLVVKNEDTSKSANLEISEEELFKNLIVLKMFELKRQQIDDDFELSVKIRR